MIIKLNNKQKEEQITNIDILDNIAQCVIECDTFALSVLEELYDIQDLTEQIDKLIENDEK